MRNPNPSPAELLESYRENSKEGAKHTLASFRRLPVRDQNELLFFMVLALNAKLAEIAMDTGHMDGYTLVDDRKVAGN